MNKLEAFKKINTELTEMEANFEMDCSGYVPQPIETEEYKTKLAKAQELYKELDEAGVAIF